MTHPTIPIATPTPEQIKAAREAAGLSKPDCAKLFGYELRSWQQKEEYGAGRRKLKPGEYAYLLLLAGQHPEFNLQPRAQDKKK